MIHRVCCLGLVLLMTFHIDLLQGLYFVGCADRCMGSMPVSRLVSLVGIPGEYYQRLLQVMVRDYCRVGARHVNLLPSCIIVSLA